MMAIDPNSPHGTAIQKGEYTPHSEVVVVWWKSKKFIAYMLGDLSWKLVILASLGLIAWYNEGAMSGAWLTFLTFVVVTAGAAQMGYLGGQSWVDRYTQVIKVPGELGKAVVSGAIDALTDHDEPTPPPAPRPPVIELEPVDMYAPEDEDEDDETEEPPDSAEEGPK